jgi:hypothetical protein
MMEEDHQLDWITNQILAYRSRLDEQSARMVRIEETQREQATQIKSLLEWVSWAKGWFQVGVVLAIVGLNLGRDQAIEILRALVHK